MDALVAFAFVFNAEATKRGVVLKRLGQATQVSYFISSVFTSFLFVSEISFRRHKFCL